VASLLAHGADVSLRTNGFTPLYIAVSEGKDEAIVDVLLARGADPNDLSHGVPPLYAASQLGRHSIASALIDAGAAVDASVHDSGATSLHAASVNGHEAIVELLLAKGARTDLRSRIHGTTPLHDACKLSHRTIIKLLVASGADVHAPDSAGTTPFRIAPRLIAAAQAGENGAEELRVGCTVAGCPGHYERRKTTHTATRGRQTFMFTNVETDVCTACGDAILDPEKALLIEGLMNKESA
jgi:YgiT-type zinc finger domain-containing protein